MIPVVKEVAMEEYLYLHVGMRLRELATLAFPPFLKYSIDWIYPHTSFGAYYSPGAALDLISVLV